MSPFRDIRSLASRLRPVVRHRGLASVALLAMLVAACSGVTAQVPVQAGQAATSAEQPAVAPPSDTDVASLTRTCVRSLGRGTALSAAECASWTASGPINLVMIAPPGVDPHRDLVAGTSPAWRPAHGRWLVAQAQVESPTRGCGAGWYSSREQVELRLSAVSRHHFKAISLDCSPGGGPMVVGDAHTDVWTPACGDHMVDLDQARDALVRSLLAGHAAARVDYLQENAAGHVYAGGCSERVTSDGRVAYVYLSDTGPQSRVS